MNLRSSLITGLLTVAVGVMVALPASATQSPAGCSANNWSVDIGRDVTVAHPGETVNFTVSTANGGAGACDITAATVSLVLPDGTNVTLVSGADFPADGSGDTTYAPVPYVVRAADEVELGGGMVVLAFVTASGTLLDVPPPLPGGSPASITKEITVDVVNPAIAVVKTPSTSAAEPGDEVTYSYAVSNTGDVPLSSVSAADDKCSPVVFVGGDDGNGVLDVGEVWDYECSVTLTETTTNVVNAGAVDDLGFAVSATDTATVTVDGTSTTTSVPASGVLQLSAEKTNDADGDGTYGSAESLDGTSGAVEFRVVISNTGDRDVQIDTITDSFAGTSQAVCGEIVGTTLPAGGTATCTFTIVDYQPEPGMSSLVNTLTVGGSEPGNPGNTASASATSQVNFVEVLPTTPDTLPATGIATGTAGGLALALVVCGLALIALTSRRKMHR